MVRVRCPALLLALALAAARQAPAQDAPAARVELRENVPNPVTSSTTISFEILPEVCARNHVPTVSLSIYNVLVQVVAVPVLDGSNALPLRNLKLACGMHQAVWDGRQLDGRPATTGVYYYQLTVDGERFTRKLIVQRRAGETT
jgi:hypothetical protein